MGAIPTTWSFHIILDVAGNSIHYLFMTDHFVCGNWLHYEDLERKIFFISKQNWEKSSGRKIEIPKLGQ